MSENTYYDVPDASPYDSGFQTFDAKISEGLIPYLPLILSAIDAELARPDVWPEGSAATAMGYIEDLKSYLADIIALPE